MPQSSKQMRATARKSWTSNAMRSVGGAAGKVFKDIAPNITNTGAGLYAGGKKVRSTLKPNNLIGISRDLTKNKYVSMARSSIKQSLADLKSGNIYNPDRADEAAMKAMGMDMDFDFDAFGDDFGDEESGGGATFINYNDTSEEAAATFALTGAVNKGTEANLMVGSAMIDTMQGLTSSVISELQSGFGEMSSQMNTMNSTLSALLEFHNENTTKFYDAALNAFNRMGGGGGGESYGDDDSAMDVFDTKGSLNMSAYKDYLKKKLRKSVDSSAVGMMASFLNDETLEMILADPVGGMTTSLVGAMVPRVVERSIKEVDKTLGEFIPNMMLEMGKWATEEKGFKKWIGKIFGVEPDELKKNVSTKEITKDAATFDQMTRNAIVEVLPKYARESTSYLREIAIAVTKKDNNALLSGSQIFDPRSNSYKTRDDMMKSFMDEMMDSLKSSFADSDFGSALQHVGGKLSGKDKESFDNTLNSFIRELTASKNALTERDYNVDDKDSAINKILAKIDGGRGDRKILRQTIKYLYDNNIGVGSAARAQQDMRAAWNTRIKDMGENSDVYNLLALGIDQGTDITKLLDNYSREHATARNNRYGRVSTTDGKRSIKQTVSEGVEGWKAEEDEYANQQLKGGLAAKIFGEDFGKRIGDAGKHTTNAMHRIMKGDSVGAVAEFGKIFTDQMKDMWASARENFFKPLGEKIFGKDDQGNAEGFFAGTRNKANDFIKSVTQKINGKDYVDSTGKTIKAEEGTSLVDKAAEMFNTVRDGVKEVLFGKTKEDSSERDGSGLFGTFAESLKQGFGGWKHAIFGDSEDPDKEAEGLKKKIMDGIPNAVMGGAGGAVIGAASGGSLLGFVIGGPVAGALIGTAVGFLSKSEKLQDYLFGPEVEETDENGTKFKRRIGGLISEKTQSFFKDNKNSIIGGAALGAVKSFIFPNSVGLLSGVIGGPLAGAAIGAGFGMLKKSQMFQDFLYGNEEEGKEGIIQSFKKIFTARGGAGKEGEGDDDSLKALGMGTIGAAGGFLSSAVIGKMGLLGAMATPLGPLGGAIIGGAVGIAAGSKKFTKFLFGEKDPETGDKKGGLFQKFGNYLHVEILSPMKTQAMKIFRDMQITLKYDILETVRLPFSILANKVSDSIGDAREFLAETVGGFIQKGFTRFVKPVSDFLTKSVLQPAQKVLGKATDILYNFSKMTILAPFRMVRAVGKVVTSKITHAVTKVTKFVMGGAAKLFGFAGAAIKVAFSPFIKGAQSIFNFFGGVKEKIGDRFGTRENPGTGIRGMLYRAGAALTSSEWRKGDYLNRAERLEKVKAAKAANRRDMIMDENRRRAARMLGYDVKYFTEDTMREAEEKALATGKRLKFRKTGSDYQFEKDPAEERRKLLQKSTADIAKNGDTSEDIDIRQLSEQHRTNILLEEILRHTQGIEEMTEEEREDLKQEMIRDAEKAGYHYDEETDELVRDEEEKRESRVKKWMDRYSKGIKDAGGIGKYLKNRIKEGYEGSDLQNMVNGGKNFLQGGRDRVRNLFRRGDATRAFGGRGAKDQPLLVGDRNHDLRAAEIFVPRTEGTIIPHGKNGINVNITGVEKKAADTLADASTKKSAKDAVKKNSYLEMRRVADEAKEIKNDNARDEKKLAVLEEIRDNNKEHQSIWSKIFSKKGLLTMGAIAVGAMLLKHIPTLKEIWEGAKNIISGIKDGIDSMLKFFGLDRENDRNSDGKSSVEILKEKASSLGKSAAALGSGRIGKSISEFVLDDGEWTASSGGKAALLAHGAVGAARIGKKLISNPAVRGVAGVAKDAVTWAAKGVNNFVGQKVLGLKMASAAGEGGMKGMLGKCLTYIDDWIMGIVEKLGAKFSKIGSSKIAQSISGFVSRIKNCVSKHFPKISGEVTEEVAGRGATGAATLGLSEIAFITMGAINGLSGTARLFQVSEDNVDNTMKIIASALGGLLGTTPGAIIDVICGLVADVLQIDVMNTIAVTIYRIIMGEDALKELDNARMEWRGKYDTYQDEEIRKEYETQKKAGLINAELSEEQFREGLKTGANKAGYMSYRDWNADQNRSIGYSIGKGLTKVGGAIGNFFGGKVTFTDENGQQYIDIGGGNYRVISASGEVLGEVTKDAVDTAGMDKQKKGGLVNGAKSIGSGIVGGIKAAGKGVSDMFTSVGQGAKKLADSGLEVARALAQGEMKISQTFNNANTSVTEYFNTDMNTLREDHPMHGLVGGILNTEKVLRFPGLMISGVLGRVGREIASFAMNMGSKAVQVGSSLAGGMTELNQVASSGDTSAFDSWAPSVPEDTPLSGIVSGILGAVKIPYWITNRTHWVGNKVGDFFKETGNKLSSMGSAMSGDIENIARLDESGDISGLWSYQPSIDESVPMAGFVSGLVRLNAKLHAPSAALNWVGSKASEFFADTANKTMDLGTSIKNYVTKLNAYADPNTDMSGFDSETMDDTSPVGLIFSPIIRTVMRFVVQIKRTMNSIGDFVGNAIDGVGNFFGDVADGAKEKATSVLDSIKNFATGGAGTLGGRGGSENGFSYYSQNDPAWGGHAYVSGNAQDGATMGDSGCGPTAMAMVATQAAKNGGITPTQMADVASRMGYRDETGTNEQFIGATGDMLGIQHQDVWNPSGEFIRSSVAAGRPVILNGVSGAGGRGGSAFTKDGHYVVAVGLDSNGGVLVNDPRGRSYSKSYDASDLASQSRKAWSFGGRGLEETTTTEPSGAEVTSQSGLSGDWLAIVRSVKSLVAAQKPAYNQSGSMTIEYGGETWKLRPDCSGLVGCMLRIYGAIPKNANVSSSSLMSKGAIQSGFTHGGWPGWEGLQEGDIITRNGHVEIFGKNEGGKHYVYNGGSTAALAEPGMSLTGHNGGYDVVWRPGNAGTGAGAVVASDQTGGAATTGVDGATAGDTTAGGATTGSAESEDNSINGIMSKVGNVFTKYASKAMVGMLTDKWDMDFSDKPVGGATTSGGAEFGTTATGSVEAGSSPGVQSAGTGAVSPANVNPTEVAKTVFAELRRQGATPAGAAGALGNLEAESGVKSNNLQDSGNKSTGMSDEQYTKAVDDGSYTNFVGDSIGYGLAQWTSAGRKQNLLKLAQTQKKSIADPALQTQHLINELQGSYKGVWNVMTSTNDLREASNAFLHKFESPKDQSAAVEEKRAGLGQGYLNKLMDGNENAPAGGLGGRGQNLLTRKNTMKIGGRGLFDNLMGGGESSPTIESGMGQLQDSGASSIPQVQTQSTNGVFTTKGIEDLLSAAIKVLESINGNTAKIEGLSQSITSIKGGDTTIVKGGDTTTTQTAGDRNSTNAALAQRIARGHS